MLSRLIKCLLLVEVVSPSLLPAVKLPPSALVAMLAGWQKLLGRRSRSTIAPAVNGKPSVVLLFPEPWVSSGSGSCSELAMADCTANAQRKQL